VIVSFEPDVSTEEIGTEPAGTDKVAGTPQALHRTVSTVLPVVAVSAMGSLVPVAVT
jgi:hypothetical protein